MYVSWSTSELRVKLVPWNMFKPSSDFLTDRSKAVLLLRILFVICVLWFSLSHCFVCFLQPCGLLLEKGWPLGSLVCDDFFLVFLSLSHMVSWNRCCIWLYRFLSFAFFLTLLLLFHKKCYSFSYLKWYASYGWNWKWPCCVVFLLFLGSDQYWAESVYGFVGFISRSTHRLNRQSRLAVVLV